MNLALSRFATLSVPLNFKLYTYQSSNTIPVSLSPTLQPHRTATLHPTANMRARRSKKYRKIMSSYQMSFSFREPYQVLLDTSFLKTCHSFHMPLQKYLENTLHGKCNSFVTRCTLAKIMDAHQKQRAKSATEGGGKGRGPGRPDFLPPPTEVPLRHCKHKNDEGEELGVVSEARCLLDLLAGQPHGNEHAKNKQHYILATADADEREQRSKSFLDVRERARMIPGVPIIYVKRSVMILEEMSGASERTIRKVEKDKFGEGLMGLGDRKRKRGEDGDGEDEDDELAADNEQDGPKIRGMKRAKGPNPLSVKKKKVKVKQGDDEEGAAERELSKKKPTRRGGRRAAAHKNAQRKQSGGDQGGAAEPPAASKSVGAAQMEA
jgi:U3 small nucleolar RNA-associated protein 23